MNCPLCKRKVVEQEEFYTEPSNYYNQCGSVECEHCGLCIYAKTLRTAKARWNRLQRK